MNPWEVLGVPRGASLAAIRRAYAAKVREFRPESHPKEFSVIREAYEYLLALVARPRPSSEHPASEGAAEPDTNHAADEDRQPSLAVPSPADTGDREAEQTDRVHRPAAFKEAIASLSRILREQGSTAASDALRALIRDAERHSIDALMALEQALVRSLIVTPDLALVRLADTQFGWSLSPPNLPPDGHRAYRLSCLLELARIEADGVAGSREQRALFGAATLGLISWGPRSALAISAGQRWMELCRQAWIPSLTERIDASTLRRLTGSQLRSTDILAGTMTFGIALAMVYPVWNWPAWPRAAWTSWAVTPKLVAVWFGLILVYPLARVVARDSARLQAVLPEGGFEGYRSLTKAVAMVLWIAVTAGFGGWPWVLFFALQVWFVTYRSNAARGVKGALESGLNSLVGLLVTPWLLAKALERGVRPAQPAATSQQAGGGGPSLPPWREMPASTWRWLRNALRSRQLPPLIPILVLLSLGLMNALGWLKTSPHDGPASILHPPAQRIEARRVAAIRQALPTFNADTNRVLWQPEVQGTPDSQERRAKGDQDLLTEFAGALPVDGPTTVYLFNSHRWDCADCREVLVTAFATRLEQGEEHLAVPMTILETRPARDALKPFAFHDAPPEVTAIDTHGGPPLLQLGAPASGKVRWFRVEDGAFRPIPAEAIKAVSTCRQPCSPGQGQGDKSQLLFQPPPQDLIFPRRAVLEGISGSVTAQMQVNASGLVTDVVILRASAPGVFDASVRDYCREFRYRPARADRKFALELQFKQE